MNSTENNFSSRHIQRITMSSKQNYSISFSILPLRLHTSYLSFISLQAMPLFRLIFCLAGKLFSWHSNRESFMVAQTIHRIILFMRTQILYINLKQTRKLLFFVCANVAFTHSNRKAHSGHSKRLRPFEGMHGR